MSATGGRLRCEKRLSPDDKCELIVHVPDRPTLRLSAEVVWSELRDPEGEEAFAETGVRFI